MTASIGEVVESGWTVGLFATWHERRRIQIKLDESFNEGLQDDLGRRFSRSLYYELDIGGIKRIWIPCFVSWVVFEFEHKGVPRSGQYMNIYCVPRDVACMSFKRQYADLFGWKAEDERVEQFWSDIRAAVEIFLQHTHDLYEKSVPDPHPPRFIAFEWGSNVYNWQDDFPKIATSALKLIREARNS